jgi:hypothetical protein
VLKAPEPSPKRRPNTTIQIDYKGILTADYSQANDVSIRILEAIRSEPIGYGTLGCALTLGRLLNPDVKLAPSQENQFLGAIMNWADSYFTIDVKGEPN